MTVSPRSNRISWAAARPAASPGPNCSPRRPRRSRKSSIRPAPSINEAVSAKLQSVHVRVNDTGTGRPTPCRIRVTDADGNYYPPLGRLTQFATQANQDVGGNVLVGLEPHAYIDGACEILLPPGPLKVHISKGPEYLPQRLEVHLPAGK